MSDNARPKRLADARTSKIDQMIADGRITPATRDWKDLPPPVPLPPGGRPLSAILQEMRDEDPR